MYPLRVGSCTLSMADQLRAYKDPAAWGCLLMYGQAIAITHQGTVMACVAPCPFPTMYAPVRSDFSPHFTWLHHEASVMELRPALLKMCEQLAVAAGHCIFSLPALNNDFWLSQGFMSHDGLESTITRIDRHLHSDAKHFESTPKEIFKVLVVDNGELSNITELREIIATHGHLLCQAAKDPFKHDFIAGSSDADVAACVTVVSWCDCVPRQSRGILERAVFHGGTLRFKRTVRVPFHRHGSCYVAIHVLPTSRTDLKQLSEPTLVHMAALEYGNVIGHVLFINQVTISQLKVNYPGSLSVSVNDFETWSQGFQIVTQKPPNITALRTLFPCVISQIISDYVAQYLPPLYSDTKPWETDFQPLLN